MSWSPGANVDARNGIWNSVTGDQHNTYLQADTQVSDLNILRKSSSAGALYNSREREPASKCLPGTREKLLDTLLKWAHGEDDQCVCWLEGEAGSGKSAASQTLAEFCAGEGTLAASFFFSRKHSERRNSGRFFATIALQMAKSIPEAKDAICQAIHENPLLPDEVLRNQSEMLIAGPILGIQNPVTSPMLVIIDALDECDDEALVGEIVALFTQMLRESQLLIRVLITSRPVMHVEEAMTDSKVASSVTTLKIRDFNVDADIRVFLRESFTDIYERCRAYMADVQQPWPSTEIMDVIVAKTSGLFIFASTVINFINPKHGRPDRQLERILSVDGEADVTPYAGLDRLYVEILSGITNNPDDEHVTRIIVLLFNPLPVRDLAQLLFRTPGEIQFELQDLQSVIMVPDDQDDPVHIYHASFRDFLVDPRRSLGHAIDQPLTHGNISQLCLSLMSKELVRDPCKIRDPSKLNSEIPDLASKCSQLFSGALQYACRYWASHLSRSMADDSDSILGDLRTFLSKSLLYWLEALSLLGQFDESAVSCLQVAIDWVKNLTDPPADILELLCDAERLVLEFFDPISVSALHVYHSALPLAPSSTRLRQAYVHEITGVITVLSGLAEVWGRCLRVMSTNGPVLCVAFSPDDTYVGSGTDEDGIQLWKTTTGTEFATLGGAGNLSGSLKFSPSGTRIAVGGKDGTTYMWDVETGLSLITVKQHEQAVTCVLFSPDSTKLASASSDQIIHIWDARAGHPLMCLAGHTDAINDLAFSPDNRRLVSAAKDSTIFLWDMDSPIPSPLSGGHKGAVLVVTFSPDGTKFASASVDKTVRVWHTHSGACIATNKAHSKSVIAIKFTSDSNSVISASDDLCIKLFTIATAKSTTIWSFSPFYRKAMMYSPMSWILQKFAGLALEKMGRSDVTINTVAFSKGATPMAFVLHSTAILVRDLKPSEDPPFADLGGDGSALAFSLQGSRMVSGSALKDISIYDPNIHDQTWEKFARKFKETEIIAVSADGSRILTTTFGDMQLLDSSGLLIAQLYPQGLTSDRTAIVGRDFTTIAIPSRFTTTIHMFDGWSGAKLPDLKGSGWTAGLFDAGFSFSVFSADGQLIALGNEDGELEIRNIASGRSVARFKEGFKGEVKCLAFSRDNMFVASGDGAGAVLCWHISTNTVVYNPHPHPVGVTSLVFSPDGKYIVSGAVDASLRSWAPYASNLTHWEGTSVATPIKMLAFHTTAAGLRLSCRSEKGVIEVWDFEKEKEKENELIPKPISRTNNGCIFANQAVGSNVFMTGDGWLFNGETRLCWIPKDYRPRNDVLYWRGTRLLSIAGRSLFILDVNTVTRT